MYLDEFFSYKNQLMEDLLTNETIVNLINPNIDFEDAGELMYKQVFPYEYVPETVEHGQTFICADVDITETYGSMSYAVRLYVWVFTHRSLLRLPEGGVRTDKLVHEIAKEIDGSHNYGFGSLTLTGVKRFAPMTDYQGKVLIFDATDWHRPANTAKPWPANRKNG